jgi:23S rRNA (cytidine1920-2'-O)/16S rRNA (cytidine1409-2'-O)-methyltransferase
VIDASFISLEKVLPQTLTLLADNGEVLALIKPQFEVGRGQVGKGGVVTDRTLQAQVVENIRSLAISLSCQVLGVTESPILGQKGNREFLIHLKKCRLT